MKIGKLLDQLQESVGDGKGPSGILAPIEYAATGMTEWMCFLSPNFEPRDGTLLKLG